MLNQSQTVAFDGDNSRTGRTPNTDYPDDQRSGIERRRHPRVAVDGDAQNGSGRPERRSSDRRSIDRLRAETTYQTLNSRPSNGIADRLNRMGMKPSRVLLLVLAIGSGGVAAYMASQTSAPPAPAPVMETITEIVPEPRIQVLVATRPIGIGQRLNAASVEWQEWPQDSILEDYFTFEDNPEALDEMRNAVARFDLFPGDPIREQKLVRDAEGYLSAVLASGMRGVSVSVAAESASGGFISPNDHVDVVLTRNLALGDRSETILQNVRVLAIDSRLGETGRTGGNSGDLEDPTEETPQVDRFSNQAIATLELDPRQAEVIISATGTGKLSLVLRAMTDFTEKSDAPEQSANQAIRLSSPFWSANFNPAN